MFSGENAGNSTFLACDNKLLIKHSNVCVGIPELPGITRTRDTSHKSEPYTKMPMQKFGFLMSEPPGTTSAGTHIRTLSYAEEAYF